MEDMFTSTLSHLIKSLPLASRMEQCRRDLLSVAFEKPLHRVNVLNGHTGCVNALSWAHDGEILLSGGDDETVRLWRMDQGVDDLEQEYPFVCSMNISTGHSSNIFAAHMLPFSSRIVTAARDKQIRVFDIESLNVTGSSGPTCTNKTVDHDAANQCRVIHCHSEAVKRIVPESGPDIFLTVSEDGSVRQHDLRTPSHDCIKSSECPTPLVKLRHQLFSLSLSPLTPYQFVVAGDAPHGYLFDRRHIGRFLEAEWGMPVDSDNVTTCVRRFARRQREGRDWAAYITGARMSGSGQEVLLSYAGDSIYLFSTKGDSVDSQPNQSSQIIPPNAKRRKLSDERDNVEDTDSMDVERLVDYSSEEGVEDSGSGDGTDDEDVEPEYDVPLILPKLRYGGISNVRTIKDVNFLGPNDEFVVSGSEDGNFFVWRRSSGDLHGIYEGDATVVNVIEGHPHLPLVAVSGIDHTVKLFSPRDSSSSHSKLDNAEAIIARNSEVVLTPRLDISSLLRSYRFLIRNSSEEEMEERCNFQ